MCFRYGRRCSAERRRLLLSVLRPSLLPSGSASSVSAGDEMGKCTCAAASDCQRAGGSGCASVKWPTPAAGQTRGTGAEKIANTRSADEDISISLHLVRKGIKLEKNRAQAQAAGVAAAAAAATAAAGSTVVSGVIDNSDMEAFRAADSLLTSRKVWFN